PYADGALLSNRLLLIKDKSDTELVADMRRALEGLSGPGVIVLPHVSKTGRILPVKEVGRLVAERRAAGQPVYLVVDGIQAGGRLSAEGTANPLAYCDAYMFGSAKALGGLLTASSVAMRQELLDAFVTRANACAAGGAEKWFCHFQ